VKRTLLLAGVAGAVVAILKRRQSAADQALWREATSDTSR
jgi:hypothetical protein